MCIWESSLGYGKCEKSNFSSLLPFQPMCTLKETLRTKHSMYFWFLFLNNSTVLLKNIFLRNLWFIHSSFYLSGFCLPSVNLFKRIWQILGRIVLLLHTLKDWGRFITLFTFTETQKAKNIFNPLRYLKVDYSLFVWHKTSEDAENNSE